MSKERITVFEVVQKLGKSFFLPISLLPFTGVLLGIGASFTNKTNIENLGLEKLLGDGTILNLILQIFSALGGVVFANLPLLFAMAIGLGLAKSEKSIATFSCAVGFLSMNTVINILLVKSGKIVDGVPADSVPDGMITSVLGIQSLQMGVFGAIILGLLVVFLHNRFYKIQLPSVISFFGGTRFVPIVSVVSSAILGAFFFVTWPVIQNGISQLGALVVNSGVFGTFLFGVIERGLIPFGLHHVFYIPIWTTGLGGQMEIAGEMYYGAQNIYFAQLADPNTTSFSIEAVRFMVGKYPFMMGGLPGAALAMYHCVPKERRSEVKGLYFGAGFTSFLTGITEPIEFTFLFLSPLLFVIHVICAGISFALCHILTICVGTTFSDGLIDFTIFGLLQGPSKTNWPLLVVLMAIFFAVYYFMFKFLIVKWDVKVPGRDENTEAKLYSKQDYLNRKDSTDKDAQANRKSAMIVDGLGGVENIKDIDACATRLRVSVVDVDKISDAILKNTGASGVLKKGTGIQVIYGPVVSVIKSNLIEYVKDLKAGKLDDKGDTMLKCDIEETYVSPMSGNLISITKVNDEAFAQKMMGDGFAVEPVDGILVSPVDGEIALVFDTKHAIGINTPCGTEMLIHMGIDTVSFNGEGFEVYCQVGQVVKAGDKLAKMDIDFFKSKGIDTVTAVLYTNLSSEREIQVLEGTVAAGDKDRVFVK